MSIKDTKTRTKTAKIVETYIRPLGGPPFRVCFPILRDELEVRPSLLGTETYTAHPTERNEEHKTHTPWANKLPNHGALWCVCFTHKLEVSLSDEVDDTAGGTDNDIHTLVQHSDLGTNWRPAVESQGTELWGNAVEFPLNLPR